MQAEKYNDFCLIKGVEECVKVTDGEGLLVLRRTLGGVKVLKEEKQRHTFSTLDAPSKGKFA